MKTIFKNELPPHVKSWTEYCNLYRVTINSPRQVVTHQKDGKSYYVNKDFAKARAYEELIVQLRKLLK